LESDGESCDRKGSRLSLAMQQVLGFIGGAFITIGFIPQVWRLFKLRSAREISLPFTVFFLLGTLCWLAYGIAFDLLPVILWNSISFVLTCAMLYAKVRYGR